MTNQQGVPEALRLADALECRTTSWPDKVFAAAELRRLHAENVRLAALVEAQQPATSVTREFTNELGNAIRITVEGPNSTHENIVTPMEAEQLRSALNEHAQQPAATAKTLRQTESSDPVHAHSLRPHSLPPTAAKEASVARSDVAINAGPRVQHKDTVLSALAAAQKPMTASQIDGVVGISVSEVRKAIRKLAAAEAVHLYAWSRENAARAWAPVWAYGQGENAPAPNGAKPVKARPAKQKPDSLPEQMARTAHLAIPVTGFRTTFVGGINPWGLAT